MWSTHHQHSLTTKEHIVLSWITFYQPSWFLNSRNNDKVLLLKQSKTVFWHTPSRSRKKSKENMHESLKIIFHESSVPRTRACAPAFCMHSTYLHIKPLLKTLPQRHRYQCNFTMQRCLYFSGHNDQQFGWNIMNINLTAQVLRNSVYHLLIRRKDDVGKKVIQSGSEFQFSPLQEWKRVIWFWK